MTQDEIAGSLSPEPNGKSANRGVIGHTSDLDHADLISPIFLRLIPSPVQGHQTETLALHSTFTYFFQRQQVKARGPLINELIICALSSQSILSL